MNKENGSIVIKSRTNSIEYTMYIIKLHVIMEPGRRNMGAFM